MSRTRLCLCLKLGKGKGERRANAWRGVCGVCAGVGGGDVMSKTLRKGRNERPNPLFQRQGTRGRTRPRTAQHSHTILNTTEPVSPIVLRAQLVISQRRVPIS